VLRAVPGVYARGEDGMGLRPNIGIRGVNPDRSKKVALMEDGVPFGPAPYSAPAAYYFPLMLRMSQVRVLKGPATITYGPQTVAGAVDLITRPIPSSTQAYLDAAVGQYGYGKLHGWAGTSDERMGFLVEGAHLRNDGFKELPSGADTGFVRNEWMFKGSYVVDPSAAQRHEFKLKLGYSDEVSNETYLGLSDADFRANPLQRYAASALDRMSWHRTQASLTHVFQPASNFSLSTTVYRTDLARTWRKANRFRNADLFAVLSQDGGANDVYRSILAGRSNASRNETLYVGPNERTFAAHGVDSRAQWNTRTGPLEHRIEYGVRLHYDRVERRQSENGFIMTDGQLAPDGGATLLTAFNEASTDSLALHAVDAISYDRLTLTPGVRIEAMHMRFEDRATKQTQSTLTQVLLPGAGAFYGITRDLGVLAGAYRGFSPPSPEGRAQPELAVNYEAGVRYMKRRTRAEIIGYYNDYSNLTNVCTQSSGCVDQNLDRQFDAGKARIYGLEAYAEHAQKLGQDISLPVQVAYTLTQAEFLRSFNSEDPTFGRVLAGARIPYVPQHQVNVTLGVETRTMGLSGAMSYMSSMRESADERVTLTTDDQLLFDASAFFVVAKGVRIYANAHNLLDDQYIVSRRPFGARPNAPRWMHLGIKLQM
jgi:Fe(3+) dicitrate transport protein